MADRPTGPSNPASTAARDAERPASPPADSATPEPSQAVTRAHTDAGVVQADCPTDPHAPLQRLRLDQMTDDHVDLLWDALERARRWATHLEGENRRLEDRYDGARRALRHLMRATPSTHETDEQHATTAGPDQIRQLVDAIADALPDLDPAEERDMVWSQYRRTHRALTRRAERAEQQLAAVRVLHTDSHTTRGTGRGDPWTPYCTHDGHPWPCNTIRALDSEQPLQQPGPASEETTPC